jgi:hypothetical protein
MNAASTTADRSPVHMMGPGESIVRSLWQFWIRGAAVDRIAYTVGGVLLVSGLIHLSILVMSAGSWQGPLSWRKPATFGLSFGLTLITIAWVASFLRLDRGARNGLLGVFTVACTLETALVTVQTWRGVPSHFNLETTLDGLVARALAIGGLALVTVIVALTFVSFRANREVPPSLRIAIRIGFVALLGAVAVGALMIAKGMTLVFAGDPSSAYATGGTLKPTHAVAMHAILVLPALAWLLSFATWSEHRRVVAVIAAALGYTVLAGVVTAANVAGIALRDASPAMLALFALGVSLLLGTGLLSLVAALRR